MTAITEPVIGQWYKNRENDALFKIVALEESDNTIEIQYYSGDIDEFEQETWNSSKMDEVEAPDDWSAAYGGVEADDFGYSDPDTHQPTNDETPLKDFQD